MIEVRLIGDCQYRVSPYLDAQNGFGAMLRTRNSATLRLSPETERWRLLDLSIDG